MSKHNGNNAWVTRGFESFRQGSFGNGGQNIYVSKAGVLQRIHLFDLNRDGWFDLLLCNSQEHWERPPAYVYHDPLGTKSRRELVSEGAVCACIADLTGDGYDDLIIGMMNNGISREMNLTVYFGSETGWSENYQTRLPAPACASVAAGDFSGNGRPVIAVNTDGKLRLFEQNELGGYDALRPIDTGIEVSQLAATDIDGDGYDDLYVLRENALPRIYWGGKDGINKDRFTDVDLVASQSADDLADEEAMFSEEESSIKVMPLARVVNLNGVKHLFVPTVEAALLLPCDGRSFGKPVVLPCNRALSVDTGRVTGHGNDDIVACGRRESWLFVGGDPKNRIALPAEYVCDVAIGDLDGDGYDDIALCVRWDGETFSVDSLVFRGKVGGVHDEPIRFASEGARRVLVSSSSDEQAPQLAFINQQSRNAVGRVSPTIYHADENGFDPARCTKLDGLGAVNGVGCDLTDDGNPDLLIANCAENALHLDPGSFVFFGRNNKFDFKPDQVLPTRAAMALVVGDINQDGYLDAIFSSFLEPEIQIYFGGPDGFDAENRQVISLIDGDVEYREGRRMCLVDLNNDGYLDLVLTFMRSDRAFVLWGSADGFDWNNKQALGIVRPATPMACDLTGNGFLDLIVGGHKRSDTGPHDSWVHVYWNGPEGLKENRKTLLPANAVLGMAIADFNGDGALDLYVGNYSDGRYRDLDSHIYWGATNPDEPPLSETRVTHVRTHSAAGCLAADFNEDGRIDLAIANHKTHGDHVGESWVVWNGADGLDFDNPTKLPSFGPHGLMHTQPGNQADRSEEEHYISAPHELPDDSRITDVKWEGELGPKTWVKVHVRTAASEGELAAAPWVEVLESEALPWVQYRLSLGATNSGSTPRVTAVTVHYE